MYVYLNKYIYFEIMIIDVIYNSLITILIDLCNQVKELLSEEVLEVQVC